MPPAPLRAPMAALRVAYRTHSPVAARLAWTAERTPRRTPGAYRLPFGRMRYVDLVALALQYQEIFCRGAYDVANLPPAPRIVDCGGNIGLSVMRFTRRYPGARITVFEADPVIGAVLEDNVRRLAPGSVEVVRAAAAARAGRITFLPDGIDGGTVIADGGAGIEVPAVRLSDRIEEPVDLLKMDVEGSEYDLFADLCDTGKIELVRNLVCEVHVHPGIQGRLGTLWESLTRSGFRLAILQATLNAALPGPPDTATSFSAVPTAKFLFLLYGWR